MAYGKSLGSGQAVRLGAARPVAAVVLEAPLTSTVDVARSTCWLPLGLLITDKYDNERNIRLVKAPVLVLHGAQDAVIPVEMGWRVYRAANSLMFKKILIANDRQIGGSAIFTHCEANLKNRRVSGVAGKVITAIRNPWWRGNILVRYLTKRRPFT